MAFARAEQDRDVRGLRGARDPGRLVPHGRATEQAHDLVRHRLCSEANRGADDEAERHGVGVRARGAGRQREPIQVAVPERVRPSVVGLVLNRAEDVVDEREERRRRPEAH